MTSPKLPSSAARTPARRLRQACIAALGLQGALPALAQSDAQEPPVLGEVRVSASAEQDVGFAPREAQTATKAPARRLETPQSISVVTREQMESRQITNLQQALQTVAGVSPVNFGRRGFDDINIRGFRSTESILIDGLVQSPGMWTRLQPYGYERIEVLKGANSVLYGQVQPGGLVNAISKRPRKEDFAEAGAEFGSFGARSGFADVNRVVSDDGRIAWRLNALSSRSDDPTDHVYRKDAWFAPSLSFAIGADTDVVVFSTYSRSRWMRQQGITPYGTVLPNVNGPLPLTRFTGDPSFGEYDVESYTLGWSLEHRLAPALLLRQGVRYEQEKGEGNFVSNGTLQANQRLQNRQASRQKMDYDLVATDTSLLWTTEAFGLAHRVVAGLDARTGLSSLASRSCSIAALDLYAPTYGVAATCPVNPTTDAPSRLHVGALYLHDQIRFNPQWTATLGLRRDHSRSKTDNHVTARTAVQRDEATTGSAGLVYEFVPGWSTYASWSSSFLPVAGTDFAGEPFAPETGRQQEIGLKHEARGLTGSLAVYELTRQNVTTSDPVNTGFSVQTGEQRARGLEIELGADLPGGTKLTAAYAYTDAKVTRDNNAAILGKPINLTPRNVIALWGSTRLPGWPGATAGLGLRHVSTQVGALPFTLPSYTVADASLTVTGDQWRITAGIKNLFDRTYYDGAINANVVSPALPRNFAVNGTWFF